MAHVRSSSDRRLLARPTKMVQHSYICNRYVSNVTILVFGIFELSQCLAAASPLQVNPLRN